MLRHAIEGPRMRSAGWTIALKCAAPASWQRTASRGVAVPASGATRRRGPKHLDAASFVEAGRLARRGTPEMTYGPG